MKPKHGVQRIDPEPFDANASNDTTQVEADEVSLEELSAAYSKLIGEPEANDIEVDLNSQVDFAKNRNTEETSLLTKFAREAGDTCVVTGRSIIEAVLFVGNPDNVGLKAESVASMMRGVQATEVVEWIAELNQHYIEQGQVMRIVEVEDGYRMQLASEHQTVRDSMVGKLRETQLNQAAIDCLSLVAYRPGISRDELERLWSRQASSVLGLLVRRDLLRIEREGKGKQAVTRYFPTDRFLNLVGIASLDDLPTAESEFE